MLHITYILYLLSLGFDNWPRPRSNVPTPRLAHDANPTALAPHGLCQSSDGNWDGWLCCASLHHRHTGVKIRDWVFAAIVSTTNVSRGIFGTNRSFYFISFQRRMVSMMGAMLVVWAFVPGHAKKVD